jgi:hypothetical protein
VTIKSSPFERFLRKKRRLFSVSDTTFQQFKPVSDTKAIFKNEGSAVYSTGGGCLTPRRFSGMKVRRFIAQAAAAF